MKGRICFAAILICFNSFIFAQQRIDNLARPSQHGIFILVGYQIASESLDHLKANIIERKLTNESSWIKLAEIAAPSSLEEFKNRLVRFSSYLPDPSGINQIPAQSLWDKLVTYKKIDSLKAWANTLPVQLALGIAYLDTTAEKESVYEYRISRVETDGNVKLSYLSNQISYPVKIVWEKTVKLIKSGSIIKDITYRSETFFPKSSENRIAHVRPHARNASDEYDLFVPDKLTGKTAYTKHCFWLNRKYIYEVIHEQIEILDDYINDNSEQ